MRLFAGFLISAIFLVITTSSYFGGAVAASVSSSAQFSLPAGTYSGKYFCAQGDTRAIVEVYSGARAGQGRFSFQKDSIVGSYEIDISKNGDSYLLTPTAWIKQPRGYSAIPIRLTRTGDRLDGVVEAKSCGEIHLARERSANDPEPQTAAYDYQTGIERRLDNSKTRYLSPLTDAEIQQVLKYIVYTENSYGKTVDESSFKYKRTISYVASESVFIEYNYVWKVEGRSAEGFQTATRHTDGFPCIWSSSQFNIACEKMVLSEAEGTRLGELTMAEQQQNLRDKPERERREAANARQAELNANAASLRREPGAYLNAQDRACLVVSYETRMLSRKTDRCISVERTAQGPVCERYEFVTDEIRVPYETNKCSRTINFRDRCGLTFFGMNSVAAGARFDPKFQSPCERVY